MKNPVKSTLRLGSSPSEATFIRQHSTGFRWFSDVLIPKWRECYIKESDFFGSFLDHGQLLTTTKP